MENVSVTDPEATRIHGTRFSPDGKVLLSASQEGLRVGALPSPLSLSLSLLCVRYFLRVRCFCVFVLACCACRFIFRLHVCVCVSVCVPLAPRLLFLFRDPLLILLVLANDAGVGLGAMPVVRLPRRGVGRSERHGCQRGLQPAGGLLRVVKVRSVLPSLPLIWRLLVSSCTECAVSAVMHVCMCVCVAVL